MYTRILKPIKNKSFFLFGSRGTGKTTWLKKQFPNAWYFDLLDFEVYNNFLARPNRLGKMIPSGYNDIVIIDEIQRAPALLHEVHRLIEERGLIFALTGSSARKLANKDVNLLAGRALTQFMYPLITEELGEDFSIQHSLKYGHLPLTFKEEDPLRYLESYVTTYLREEVQQEGLTRNLGAFSRFLETASFSEGQLLNVSAVASECGINRKVAENYFCILEDLLVAKRIPVFTKKAKRRMSVHPKFFFFDTGVYRAIRPKGPLDTPEDIDGAALETLVLQEITAINHYNQYGYSLYFWRTADGQEIDFVLYGEKGLLAIEVKRGARLNDGMFKGLKKFLDEYPMARAFFVYGGDKEQWEGNIHIIPIADFLKNLGKILGSHIDLLPSSGLLKIKILKK